jgi:hypothetical protein
MFLESDRKTHPFFVLSSSWCGPAAARAMASLLEHVCPTQSLSEPTPLLLPDRCKNAGSSSRSAILGVIQQLRESIIMLCLLQPQQGLSTPTHLLTPPPMHAGVCRLTQQTLQSPPHPAAACRHVSSEGFGQHATPPRPPTPQIKFLLKYSHPKRGVIQESELFKLPVFYH